MDFSALKISGAVEYDFEIGDKCSYEVTHGKDDAEITQNGKTLVIGQKSKGSISVGGSVFSSGSISITGGVIRGGAISIGSSEKVRVKITAPSLEKIKVAGATGGRISGMQKGSLEIDANGASSLEVSGHVDELDLDISGAVNIDTRELHAGTTEVEISGAATVKLGPSRVLRGDVSGAANVTHPDIDDADVDTSGAASVKKKTYKEYVQTVPVVPMETVAATEELAFPIADTLFRGADLSK